MLKKVGQGTTIEDLQKVKGGIRGSCGHNGCAVCGYNGNDQKLNISYTEWLMSDY